MAEGATLGVGDDDLVTGDAVALRLPVANVGLRILSGLIDVGAGVLLLLGLFFGLGGLLDLVDEALADALVVLVVVTVMVVLPVVVETVLHGRSLGRMATGTCVVRSDGGPVTLRQSLTRALVGVVETWMTSGAIAMCACVFAPRGQRLGDLAAGTVCVRERMRLVLPPPIQPVPQLEGWARAADLGPLPDGLALAVRQFFLRTASFDPTARRRLGEQLAADVLQHVSPAPPPGLHPESLLQAVIAERSRRDAERLHRDAALRDRLHLS